MTQWELRIQPDPLKYYNSVKKVDISPAAKQYVEDTWKKYDYDENGYLDLFEARKFI